MSNFEMGKHKMHGLFFKKADRFYDGPPGKKYYDPQNLNVGSNLNANQVKANDQLSGNVPIPGVPQDPRGGKYEDKARTDHYIAQANTNVANLKPGTLASDRYAINGQNDQRVINFMGTSLLGGGAANVIAPRIANLPFKAWAAARAAFPTFNTGVISPVLKTVTDYANAAPKVPIR
jgi:hypothetical protein